MYIDKNEVLRYLGINNKDIDKKLIIYIQDCIDEMAEIANPKYIYKIYDINHAINFISIVETNIILKGNSIKKHLEDSTKCSLLGATLGINVDKRIEYYKSYDLTRSIVLDACGTAFIEKVCDDIEEKIRKEAKEKYDLNITSRFSPGYGDLSLNIQPNLLNILDANKIGLTVTEQLIMIPRKSVTAIIGFMEKENKLTKGCKYCLKNKNCRYRKE